jgi:hypothetical protein
MKNVDLAVLQGQGVWACHTDLETVSPLSLFRRKVGEPFSMFFANEGVGSSLHRPPLWQQEEKGTTLLLLSYVDRVGRSGSSAVLSEPGAAVWRPPR